MKIEVVAETTNMPDMSNMLRKIADAIDAGNLNGLDPIWRLHGADIDALWNGPTIKETSNGDQ